MASTFSTSLKLELIGDGDQSGIWGQTTNNNLGTLIEQAITGVASFDMLNSNYTLTSFNGVADEARNAVLVATGANSAVRDIIAPLVEKVYIVKNSTTGGYGVRIIGATGTGVTVPPGSTVIVYCDGTNFYAVNTESVGDFTVNGTLDVTGNVAITGATTLTGPLSGNVANLISSTITNLTSSNVAISGGTISNLSNLSSANATITNISNTNLSSSNVTITGGSISGITDLAIADGGTGASNAAAARTNLGLGSLATQNSVLPANMFAGAVLQVVQAVKSDTFTTSSTSYVDITGMSASITPRNSSSRILVFVDLKVSSEDNNASTLRLLRDSTEVGGSSGTNGGFMSVGNPAFYRPGIWQVSFNYLDSPSTSSSVTYKVQAVNSGGGFSVNYAFNNAVLPGRVCVSTITLVEIAG